MDRKTVAKMVQDFMSKAGNEVGGNLHIVLDDGNLTDSHILHCIETAGKYSDHEAVEIGKAILELSKTQRRKLYNNGWKI